MQRYLDVVEQAKNKHAQNDLSGAAYLYEHLLGSQPDDPVVLYLYGTLYSQTKRFGSAITLLNKAVALAPELTEAWHNLGVAYRSEGHTDAARQCYQKAISNDPKNSDYKAMMAGSYVNTGSPKEAIKWADLALEIDPRNPHARNHKALALLELGRWSEAWPYYETRYEIDGLSMSKRPYTCPKWEGGKVRKLAVHGEQGVGDEIMFFSCLPDLIDRAETVVIECEPRLRKLLTRTFSVETYGTHDELIEAHPDVDAYIPCGDMAAIVRQSPSDCPGGPYLKVNEAKAREYREQLEAMGPGPYVGIAWHGGTKGTHQELRNPPNECWKSFVKERGTFISLQYGELALEGAIEIGVPHYQSMVEDLDNFAAAIAALDLVVSPCQTAIHFAGAIGAPCWCLTPDKPAWRYGLKGDMPWYGSVKLYRQDRDWFRTFNKVVHDFRKLPRAESQAA